MATTRPDKKFAKRFVFWLFGSFFVYCLVLPPIIDALRAGEDAGAAGLILVSLILPVPLICILVCGLLFCRYRCGECGATLPLPRKKPGRLLAFRFYCGHCDIMWDKGMTELED